MTFKHLMHSHKANGRNVFQPDTSATERQILWSSSEGQVANASCFVLAGLLFWLVIPLLYAVYRYWSTARHRYELSDRRLLERSGIWVRTIESLELYRVRDIKVSGTLLQTLFGRGRVILQTNDASTPVVVINAIVNPEGVAQLVRDAVEATRLANGVRALDINQ